MDEKPNNLHLSRLGIAIVLCLTLGLAPFTPEPHLFGKIKWLAGGGVGMKLMDYWDFIMHGAPFVLLLLAILNYLRFRISKKKNNPVKN